MSRVFTCVSLVALVAVSACGGSGEQQTQPKGSTPSTGGGVRTVQVEMVDRAFRAPALGTVRKGDKITFTFTNNGKLDHEAFIGDAAAQLAYVEELQKITKSHAGASPHGNDGHDDHPKGSVHVKSGDTAELTYTFSEGEEVEIACFETGHYEAGMKLTIQAQ